jgi:hypothetical protein
MFGNWVFYRIDTIVSKFVDQKARRRNRPGRLTKHRVNTQPEDGFQRPGDPRERKKEAESVCFGGETHRWIKGPELKGR